MWQIGLLVAVTTLVSSTSGQSFSVQPANWTTEPNNSVLLDCAIDSDYTGYFEWRVHVTTTSLDGQLIYSVQGQTYKNMTKFPASKYQRHGAYGLLMTEVEWKQAALYICSFLELDLHARASVVVIEELVASINPQSENSINDSVQLSCQVLFSGPFVSDNNQLPQLSDQFPQLLISLGSQTFDELSAPVNYTAGTPGLRLHSLTRTVNNYTLTAADVDSVLTCQVKTANPQFLLSANTTLYVTAPAHDITVTNQQPAYAVNDVINCTAKGRPTPQIHWQPVMPSQGKPTLGASLLVTSDMIGENTWKCVAQSNGTIATEYLFHFNVTAGVKPAQDSASSKEKTIGLAVGLTIGLLTIFAAAALIVFLYIRRRKQSAPGKKTFVYSSVNPEGAAYKAGPIYQPRPQSTSPHNTSQDNGPHDRSGYGDLGAGGVNSPDANTTTAPLLNNSRPKTAAEYRPSAPVYSDEWPERESYANIPPPPVTSRSASNSALDQPATVPGATTATPATPMGFADLGFGNPALKGSVHSLSKMSASPATSSVAAAAAAPRAANRSVDRSMDSGSSRPSEAAGYRPSRQHGGHGSNPSSLDQSADLSSRLSPDMTARLAGAPPTNKKPANSKPGSGRPPVPPPNKPITSDVSSADEMGTIV